MLTRRKRIFEQSSICNVSCMKKAAQLQEDCAMVHTASIIHFFLLDFLSWSWHLVLVLTCKILVPVSIPTVLELVVLVLPWATWSSW